MKITILVVSLFATLNAFAGLTYNKPVQIGETLVELNCKNQKEDSVKLKITNLKVQKYQENVKFLSRLDLTINQSTTESYIGRYEFEDVSMSFKGSAKGVSLTLNAYADELDQTTLTFTQAGRNIELRLNCN